MSGPGRWPEPTTGSDLAAAPAGVTARQAQASIPPSARTYCVKGWEVGGGPSGLPPGPSSKDIHGIACCCPSARFV